MKNFKLLFLLMLGMFVMFQSCEKKELQVEQDVSDGKAGWEKEYRHELIVTSDDGENVAFYYIYADNQELLDNYISTHNFTLKTNSVSINNIKKDIHKTSTKLDFDKTNLIENEGIIIELERQNLKENVKSFSLEMEVNKQGKSIKGGSPIAVFTTKNSFIGIISTGVGFDNHIRFQYKKHWYSNWKYESDNAYLFPTGYNVGASYSPSCDCYKIGIVVLHDPRQDTPNYTIVYKADDFRGNICSMGTLDPNVKHECFVGSSPLGSTAFVYRYGGNNNRKYFFYTPVNGIPENCPRPGSQWDGANCRVMKIPADVDAYTWRRNWLVKTDYL